MNKGITVRILGDSSPFSKVGKSISYLITIGKSNYLVDCGAQLFQQIGGFGLKTINGLIITHCHDDHKRWLTDLAIFYRYAPDITGKVPIFASEEVSRELCRMAEPALDRTLSQDSRTIIDVPCENYVNYTMLGPSARYRIVLKDGLDGTFQLCVLDSSDEVVGPDRAKIVISTRTKRPRMLFKDPEYNEWIEPESFYSFSSDIFYEDNKNILHDDEGFTIEAVQAPVWHGIPNIGVKFKTANETLIFSSDTFHDRAIWKELCDKKRTQKLKMTRKEFEAASIIHGDINDYIQRTWSRERYEEAINAFNDAVVIHDVSVRDSIVHTSYNKLDKTSLKKEKTILTHSPDRITSEWALCSTEKIFRIKGDQYFEVVDDRLLPMNADIYHKENGKYYVGYKNEKGPFAVYEKDGMHRLCLRKEVCKGEVIYRVDLYEDICGRYVPVLENDNEYYRHRKDGRVERVNVHEHGSTGTIVEDHRERLLNEKMVKSEMKLQNI
jgi:ribonuclease BN (tRNA processing enzyme)